MPWRNGAGVTAEVATGPPGAAMEAFAWRVAIADLPASGPFSTFPGIERTLYLLPGPPVTLVVDGHATDLDGLEAVDFAGESETGVIVEEGPTRDLNAMARRGVVTHGHRVLRGAAPVVVALPAGDAVLHVARGALTVDDVVVGKGETVVWRATPGADVRIAPAADEPASAILFTFSSPEVGVGDG